MRDDKAKQRMGNGAADQGLDAQFRQLPRHQRRLIVLKVFLRLFDDAAVIDLHQMNPPSHVENRRDALIPACECRPHAYLDRNGLFDFKRCIYCARFLPLWASIKNIVIIVLKTGTPND